jgi:hypothetical protein
MTEFHDDGREEVARMAYYQYSQEAWLQRVEEVKALPSAELLEKALDPEFNHRSAAIEEVRNRLDRLDQISSITTSATN